MRKVMEDGDLFIIKQHQDHGNSKLLNIPQLALTESTHNSNWTPSLAATSAEWRPAIEERSSIGWIHLYMGRISQQLIAQMEDHYRSLNLNTKQYTGERWACRFIINIWNLVLRLWKQRNKLIFDKDNQLQIDAMHDKLEERVNCCYALKDELASNDRHIWFATDIEEKMQEEPRLIQTWLTLVERLLCIAKREQRKRPWESYIMDKFLGLHYNHTSTHHNQGVMKPRAYQ
jgi:hypothetical protein